jgi:hypothetical protein
MKVRINYLTYEIKEEESLLTDKNIVLNGDCDHENLVIHLQKNLVPERKRQVLLHELLHAITDNLELHLDEEEIEMTSIGLMMFLVDNMPFIKKVIAEVEKEGIDNKVKK